MEVNSHVVGQLSSRHFQLCFQGSTGAPRMFSKIWHRALIKPLFQNEKHNWTVVRISEGDISKWTASSFCWTSSIATLSKQHWFIIGASWYWKRSPLNVQNGLRLCFKRNAEVQWRAFSKFKLLTFWLVCIMLVIGSSIENYFSKITLRVFPLKTRDSCWPFFVERSSVNSSLDNWSTTSWPRGPLARNTWSIWTYRIQACWRS